MSVSFTTAQYEPCIARFAGEVPLTDVVVIEAGTLASAEVILRLRWDAATQALRLRLVSATTL